MRQASLVVTWDRVLGDAAFDSEEHHRLCREDLCVRSTVIPINRRNQGRKWPKTEWHFQSKLLFSKSLRRHICHGLGVVSRSQALVALSGLLLNS
jgi:hypothetical protein